ncbi:head GIN domain-containing protein [Croceiramulus getboli]|nr:DUF2807 domain-containing protein [Flavobacteriaceae bacterium YJPT1-3]
MKTFITLILAIAFTLPASAQWWGKNKRVKGNGDETTITREVGSYDQVNVAGFFDVELVAGKEGSLTLKGESNLLEYIITEVENGALKIKTEKGVNLDPSWNKTIFITVPFEDLEEVTLSGSGDVIAKDVIKADQFRTAVAGSGDLIVEVDAGDAEAKVAGSGDLTIKGRATNFTTAVAGSGDVHASDLKAENVTASVAGSGDISVYCSGMFKARVSGSGDIEYSGNPQKEDIKVAGSGSVSN